MATNKPEKIRLTDARIRELTLPPGKAQIDVWDSDQPGFGIRIGAKSKTFFVMGRTNGRQVRPKIGSFPKIGATRARSEAKLMLADLERGINPSDSKRAQRTERKIQKLSALDTSDTLNAMFEKMIATRTAPGATRRLSPVTVQGYGYAFKNLHPFHNRKVDSITREQVLELHKAINDNSGGYAANRASCLLSAVLNYSRAVIGRPALNPVTVLTDVKAWFEEKPRPAAAKPADIPALMNAIDQIGGNNLSDLYRLLVYTGLRKSEGMRLSWEHINFDADTLHIPKTKTGEPLTLPLPRQIKTLLANRWKVWQQPTSGPVFPTHSISGHATQDYLAADQIKKVIPGFSAHHLRKLFTSVAVATRIDGLVIDYLTNHRPQGMTAKHYFHPDIDDLREPMQKIADKIDEFAAISQSNKGAKNQEHRAK